MLFARRNGARRQGLRHGRHPRSSKAALLRFLRRHDRLTLALTVVLSAVLAAWLAGLVAGMPAE